MNYTKQEPRHLPVISALQQIEAAGLCDPENSKPVWTT